MAKKNHSAAEEMEEPEQASRSHHRELGMQEQQRYRFSEGCEMAADLADKLEEVKNIPIMYKPRILDLVAKFSAFPWAQDTVMAAHQLHEVLILFLWSRLNLRGPELHR